MISDDFTIDYTNKRIYHSANNNIYTVNALYTYLQDTFDELSQMDDTIPMSAQTPTDYTLENGWFMDDTSYHFLKGGAIKTSGYNNEIYVLNIQASGYTSAVSGDIGKTVHDAGSTHTGVLLAYNNTTRKWWIRKGTGTFANSDALTITSGTGAGSIASSSGVFTGEDLFPNLYTLGSIDETNSQQIYIVQNGARLASGSEWWPESGSGTQHIDVLIKIKEAGVAIDSGRLTIFLRHYPNSADHADLYDHFSITISPTGTGGRNAIPLATSLDLNNATASGTVAGYSDISIVFVNGTISYSAISGSFTDLETVTQATSGATGVFLKQSTTTGAGTMTLGNVVGTFDNSHTITGQTSGKTATASSTLTETYSVSKAFEQDTSHNYSVVIDCASRTLSQVYEYLKYVTRAGSTFTMYPTAKAQGGAVTHTTLEGQQYIRAHEDNQNTPDNTFSPVKASPFGTFAGGKLFGAQGVWVQTMAGADIQAFQLIDSDGVTRTPPNKQSITISNLLSLDRVSVFRTSTGSTIDKAIFTAAAGNSTGNSTFVVNESIPVDTPSSGVIRIVDTGDTGATRETRYTYTSWSGSTFSGLSPTLDRDYTDTSDTAYVPFIDTTASGSSVSVQVIYSTDRTILVRVRRYQGAGDSILPFETTGTFGSTGYSTSAIRTADTIVG